MLIDSERGKNMRIYDQNIWGNFSAEGQYVANRNRLNNAEQLKAKEFLVLNTEKSRASSDHLPLIFDFELI